MFAWPSQAAQLLFPDKVAAPANKARDLSETGLQICKRVGMTCVNDCSITRIVVPAVLQDHLGETGRRRFFLCDLERNDLCKSSVLNKHAAVSCYYYPILATKGVYFHE